MRILVTGGTGYLGQAIVRAAVTRGHEPVVFARHASAARLTRYAIDGDVRDRTALVEAARGCEVICHAAALVSIWQRDPREFDAVNVGGLENAIEAAKAVGVTRLVYTSSFLARPPAGHEAPIRANDYQRTKVLAHGVAERARDAGVPIVLLYPGVLFGPGLLSEGNLLGRMLADQAAGRLPALIGPDRLWSFAWAESVAEAHIAAAERAAPGSAYALGGENLPQVRAFEVAREHTGRPVPRRLPYWAASAIGAAEETRARLTGRTPRLTRGAVEIFRHDWPLDSSAAVRDLNFRPLALVEGIRALLGDSRNEAMGQ